VTGSRPLAISTAALLALLLPTSTSLAGSSAPKAVRSMNVAVTAKDYSFTLSATSSAVGKVTFSVKNGGKHDHNFQINGKKTSVLKPGKSSTLAVTFGKAGSFTYQSTVGDDAKKGMKGTFAAKDVSAGKKVFVSTGCGACHVMKAAGTSGTLGPSLDKSKASRSTIENVITKGKGTMPAYKAQLTSKQIDDVSEFVFQARTG
jgi:plastocyanin